MSKFWAGSGSSSDKESDDGSDDDAGLHPNTPPVTDTGIHGSFSTPPRQPILPVDDPTEAWERVRPNQVFSDVPTRTGPANPSTYTRIALISDTHGHHRSIPVPPCDILIHGGDFANFGEPEMVRDVSDYFAELKRNGTVENRVICIAGNHELTFQPDHYNRVWRKFQRPKQEDKFDTKAAMDALQHCTYLEDEASTCGAIRFYGSPWQPEFYGWAFNLPRADIASKWERIPDDTDVLVTHGPPLGRGDETSGGCRTGCVTLMKEVQTRIKPRLHVFGHIHESYGVTHDGTTMYVNASSVSRNYTRHNPCIIVDLPRDQSMPAPLVKPECTLNASEVLAWLRRNNYERLLQPFEMLEESLTGREIVEGSYDELCCRLLIHRDERCKVELRQARDQLWRESFS